MRIDRIVSSAAVVKLNVQNHLKYGFFLAVSFSIEFFLFAAGRVPSCPLFFRSLVPCGTSDKIPLNV